MSTDFVKPIPGTTTVSPEHLKNALRFLDWPKAENASPNSAIDDEWRDAAIKCVTGLEAEIVRLREARHSITREQAIVIQSAACCALETGDEDGDLADEWEAFTAALAAAGIDAESASAAGGSGT